MEFPLHLCPDFLQSYAFVFPQCIQSWHHSLTVDGNRNTHRSERGNRLRKNKRRRFPLNGAQKRQNRLGCHPARFGA